MICMSSKFDNLHLWSMDEISRLNIKIFLVTYKHFPSNYKMLYLIVSQLLSIIFLKMLTYKRYSALRPRLHLEPDFWYLDKIPYKMCCLRNYKANLNLLFHTWGMFALRIALNFDGRDEWVNEWVWVDDWLPNSKCRGMPGMHPFTSWFITLHHKKKCKRGLGS
jgi:hypothetical protein